MTSSGRREARAAVLVAGFLLAACATSPAPTPSPEELLTGEQLMAGIRLTPTVTSVSFVATGAFADLGIDEGIRLVKVRIMDAMAFQVRIETPHDVTFADPPKLCLVGPYSAPDDAGLEDRCWGEPDASVLLAPEMPKNQQGQPILNANTPIDLAATLSRGTVRCDYPAGKWVLELKGRPVIDGAATEALWAPEVDFDVPLGPPEPLPYLKTDQTRYCGLATLVYRDQGEPETLAP